ncbi:GNAT family N-acetyltransferase [Alteromonas gilva]|uniref:GNAT family N-acetyltransferase n=1 Tax=Alteromonas gilva TaxID=2987522 RepID=A0ABT5L1D3_9ALTE|nr:GNAT family N-acetyltransferase [Alteromonas gilva]MDC8830834.1 GNAT family N-acetyltransferase [Alteromonas gilva]
MAYKVQRVLWQEAQAQLKSLRKAVFVLEWRLPESAEFDELDNKAFHVLLLSQDDHPIATARLTQHGEIGRIAVLPKHRNTSVYNTLFAALLKQATSQNIEQIHVQSALDRVEYHRQKGFKPVGPVFMEAGIPMQKMVCQRQQFDAPDVRHIH